MEIEIRATGRREHRRKCRTRHRHHQHKNKRELGSGRNKVQAKKVRAQSTKDRRRNVMKKSVLITILPTNVLDPYVCESGSLSALLHLHQAEPLPPLRSRQPSCAECASWNLTRSARVQATPRDGCLQEELWSLVESERCDAVCV